MSQFWNGEVLAAPNLITVCVDESQASEISGRLYHGYSQEPQSFENVVQLIRYMADFYDSIRFPESSVVLREFSPEKRAMEKLQEKSMEYQQLMEQNGICATFHIFVKYRQNERRTSGDGILQCPGTDHRDGCHTGKKIKVQKKAGTLRKDKDSCFLLYRRKTSKSITFHILVIRSHIRTQRKIDKKTSFFYI